MEAYNLIYLTCGSFSVHTVTCKTCGIQPPPSIPTTLTTTIERPEPLTWLSKTKVQNLALLSFFPSCLETDLRSQELWSLVI